MKDNQKFLIYLVIAISIILTLYLQRNNNATIINKPETSNSTIIEASQNDNESNEEILETISSPIQPELKVYFFDVGQGDSIFVENGDDCMLIDAGNNPDGKYISKYLRNKLNIKEINYLIGTHSHEDHIGGMDIIIEDIPIKNFYMPQSTATNKTYLDVLNWAKKKNLEVKNPSVGDTFVIGKATCEIMSVMDNQEEENENSIVVQLTFGNQKFLFTADMEATNESSRKWNDIDVLKVAHHGSTYTNSESFLEEVKPEIAVITCGKDNDYYYPHEAVLKRLNRVGCKEIYVTSEKGTVVITSDGLTNTVECLSVSFDGNI